MGDLQVEREEAEQDQRTAVVAVGSRGEGSLDDLVGSVAVLPGVLHAGIGDSPEAGF